MNFITYIEESSNDNIWYHGSGMDFDEFKTDAKPATESSHHGYGIYLVDNISTAQKYVDEYAVGQNGVIYTCKLSHILEIPNWDDMIDINLFMEMADEISSIDADLSDEMKEYPDGYHGETFTYGELYDVLKHVDGHANPNEFFKGFYIDGFRSKNRIDPDADECCIFDPTDIKIIKKEQVK
jgi:hypothetical protein